MGIIETSRLNIRRFKEEDWEALYDYLSDKKVVKYEPYDVYSPEGCQEEARFRASSTEFFAVCLKDGDQVIGNIYLGEQDFNTYMLGYVFNTKYQGYGYATESAKAVMAYSFEKLNARRIVAMCNPQNEASWKVLERLGMRREGHLIQNIWFKKDKCGNLLWLDTYEYALLACEWKRAQDENRD